MDCLTGMFKGCGHIRLCSKKCFQHSLKGLLVGKHTLNVLLRMMKFARSHHLHGTRNLAGAVDRSDSVFNFFE